MYWVWEQCEITQHDSIPTWWRVWKSMHAISRNLMRKLYFFTTTTENTCRFIDTYLQRRGAHERRELTYSRQALQLMFETEWKMYLSLLNSDFSWMKWIYLRTQASCLPSVQLGGKTKIHKVAWNSCNYWHWNWSRVSKREMTNTAASV